MALKDRLKTLQRQTGREGPATGPERGFADRVSRLRSAGSAPRPGQPAPVESVAEMLGGEVIAEGLIQIEKHLPLASRHGELPLERVLDDHAALPEAAGLDVRGAVFFDTETTGLSGGSGTAVFLLGLARIWRDALVIRQYLLTSFSGERLMLEDAARWMEGGGTLVSFNGKSFDQPLLTARARLCGAAGFPGRLAHLDLLHPTRRAFGKRWPDCRLMTAERELLGFARIGDLPGSEAPEAWFSFLHRGDASRLPGITTHNRWDVVSLAALLPVLAEVHRSPVSKGADVLSIARAMLRAGDGRSAFGLLREAENELDRAGQLELARLHRGRGDWEGACAIWERLADQECSEALERLAKFHEHVRGDWEKALAFARRLPPSVEQEHRCRRLRAKLARKGGISELL